MFMRSFGLAIMIVQATQSLAICQARLRATRGKKGKEGAGLTFSPFRNMKQQLEWSHGTAKQMEKYFCNVGP